MTPSGTDVVLALGSNLGDRMERLRNAVKFLEVAVDVHALSPVFRSRPEGLVDEDAAPDFLNAVLAGSTALDPPDLLELCLSAEAAAGRSRERSDRAPRSRVLDVDIIFYGDRVIATPELVVPHPRWKERGFVLRPLLAVAPDWRDPASGMTVRQICRTRERLLETAQVVSDGALDA